MPMTSYRVTIAGVTATAPRDGFIDNKTVERHVADGATAPTTYAQTTAKERANIRFDFLQQQIQLQANVYIVDIETAGATATTPATSFVFTAQVERGDEVLYTLDEQNVGQVLTGEDALKRWVARSLTIARNTYGDIYDPTKTTTPGNSTPEARYGVRLEKFDVGALAADLTAAEALVTIVAL